MNFYPLIDQCAKDNDFRRALVLIDYALAHNPRDHILYRAKARSYGALKLHAKAVPLFKAAMKLSTTNFEDSYNAAVALLDIAAYDKAIEYFDIAISVKPNHAKARLQRGACYWELRQWDKAIENFESASSLEPNNADVAWVCGLLYLQLGNFEKGWPGYESRWDSLRFKSARLLTKKPKWSEGKNYKSVLVWGEQGIGDQIIYASMLPTLSRRVDKVTMMIDPRLIPLFSRSMPYINFVSNAAELPADEHDSHLPIASIGAQFVRKLSDIKNHVSRRYLKADPERVAQIREKLPKGKKIVGLSWTSAAPKIGPHKSISLDTLAPITSLNQFVFVDLQYARTNNEVEHHANEVINSGVDCYKDFEGLAALLECCDYVVSVSSSTVHLAGAMGRPVLLMDANKLWYWGNKEGDYSLWYPSVKIFPRDHVLSSWNNVVMRVRDELLLRSIDDDR